MRRIELLSPAKDIECGIAAINHGADAVYIGAQKFGARAAAGNSVSDIERLAKHAHLFDARVYVTVNTILKDSEIEDARKLITELYEAGADALIVQDYSILRMDIPPIALHSSTQIDTRDAEKAKFLKRAGFSQIVVARELGLEEIKKIHEEVEVPLEAFVHGALCVSYSGQCYLSQELTNRSANRGECSQPCRMAYDLIDKEGRTIVKDKYLLSLKDMNRSKSIKEMIEAGVSSFKIEGRLKSASYVKNITAYYRRVFDEILEKDSSLSKGSAGKIYLNFTPNTSKSFSRGQTEYMLDGQKEGIASPLTPKSTGEEIGTITYTGKNYIEIKTDKEIHNGDGLCLISTDGHLTGLRANKAEGNRIYTDSSSDSQAQLKLLKKGLKINRNLDTEFEKAISQENSGTRKVRAKISLKKENNRYKATAECEDGVKAEVEIEGEFEEAKNKEMAAENLRKNLKKTGNTIYEIEDVEISEEDIRFIPNSIITEKKRELTEALDKARALHHKRDERRKEEEGCIYPHDEVGHEGNINNKEAKAFLEEHGVRKSEESYELRRREGVALMTCRHCIKRIAGLCAKNGRKPDEQLKQYINTGGEEPLYLRNAAGVRLRLEFDCKRCEMKVFRE